MSRRKQTSNSGAMLDLWRPPQGAGEPVGCLASTYTFAPGLFDEQCLARFLEIDSEPNREDLAFLLERESRLGSVYAGVLVDHTQAGVEHSLRWDVLPVRIRRAKQHAKLSLLAWSRHVRIVVASANITDPGYRSNYEVAASVDLSPEGSDRVVFGEAVAFLRDLIGFVSGATARPPEVMRADAFLAQVEKQVEGWTPASQKKRVRQRLTCTLPANGQSGARSSLDEAVHVCRRSGGSPHEAWIASPFFDVADDTSRVTVALCKSMARRIQRELCFCVPASRDEDDGHVPRLAAPKALIQAPTHYAGHVSVEMLPEIDGDRNRRPWHAKMLGLFSDAYSALMVGSSNFTRAGMGAASYRNAEANLLTIVKKEAYGREAGRLEAVWPDMDAVEDPESAEWLGAKPEREEEEMATARPLPAGFLSATYAAGDVREIVLRLDPPQLPTDWSVHACGRDGQELLSSGDWENRKRPVLVRLAWDPVQPPEKLLVQWEDYEGFLVLNVEDSRHLPPPAQLEKMSADDMLLILAASDPSGAFRVWAKQQQTSDEFDSDLDSATPVDLDPLRRYDLQATYLHRIRSRARVLARLRANLERPVWGLQALEWRLRGLIGISQLADRLLREFVNADGAADEALLTLADFLIVLHEVDYAPRDGSLSKTDFDGVYQPFLRELAVSLTNSVRPHQNRVPRDLMEFWKRVEERCQG